MNSFEFGSMLDLHLAGGAFSGDQLRLHGADPIEQLLADRHRDSVFLLLEAVRPGHATTSRIESSTVTPGICASK